MSAGKPCGRRLEAIRDSGDPQLLARFSMKPRCLGLLLAGLVLAQQPMALPSQQLKLLWQFDTGG